MKDEMFDRVAALSAQKSGAENLAQMCGWFFNKAKATIGDGDMAFALTQQYLDALLESALTKQAGDAKGTVG